MSRRRTTLEKIKSGSIRKDRMPVVAKKNKLNGYPKPLEDLTDKEFEIYKRLCDHLRDADGLYDADTFLLTSAAVNLAKLAEIIPELRDKGLIQEFDNGTRNVSPEFSIFDKANALFLRHSKHLGLDPLSRQNMLIFIEQGGEQDNDPLAGEIPGLAR